MLIKKIVKKDGTEEPFDIEKVVIAIKKSAERVLHHFTDEELLKICSLVKKECETKCLMENRDNITVFEIHCIVEGALEEVNPKVAKSYRDYRNYKIELVEMMDKVFRQSQQIYYIGDKENSNTDSALVSTKRCLVFNYLNKELYQKFFLNKEEIQACRDGYIYIHDMSARRDTMNCCLFDIGNVLKGGFEMGNIWYNEPNSLDTAFDVIGDITLSAASQQYGGFTLPNIETILKPYAEKTYNKCYEKEFLKTKENLKSIGIEYDNLSQENKDKIHVNLDKTAYEQVSREMEQGFQGWEYKFNTVASSRGDYPFITISAGIGKSKFEKLATITMLNVRKKGQGKKGHKKPVLFPKLVFLYDENLHGEGKELEDIFNAGIECSSKTMYPDWLSLSGDGYVPSIYKKYGKVISPMGCRAFLSPWYEKGGIEPLDENDIPIFVGRFNIGAISLHLPMILAKSKKENKDFYEVLNYYMEMIRGIHIRTYNYLGEMKASINPLGFCEGGFLGGNLNFHDKIKPILKSSTASFGITALNELQRLYNGFSIYEDGKFALEVMNYINNKIQDFKREDNILYAIYATPAESLCGTQIKQFRKKYGIVKNVSDKEYVSNSFHCHVSEKITPIQKQDSESRFWDLFNGGKIQYCKYPISYNKEAIKTLVRRAMKLGLYEGVNLSLSYCDDCGHEELNMEVCPKCGSKNLTKIDRMNGYLSYSRVKGDTRLNDAKMAEIKDRESM